MNTQDKNNKKKRIILTGGGTAGHVIPQIAIIKKLQELNFDILYLGTNGIEKNLIKAQNINFAPI